MTTCAYRYHETCQNDLNLFTNCCGIEKCRAIRDGYREDIAMEMRNDITIDVDAFPEDWYMLAEYFTIK